MGIFSRNSRTSTSGSTISAKQATPSLYKDERPSRRPLLLGSVAAAGWLALCGVYISTTYGSLGAGLGHIISGGAGLLGGSVAGLTMQDVQAFFKSYYRPNGMIIACAGKIDFDSLRDHVEKLFGDWQPNEVSPSDNVVAANRYQHIEHESEQTHIALAYPGFTYSDSEFYLNRGAVGVLSGGMSSRLFTEVREKRGLCYSVFASCHTLLDKASVICYSGTSSDRAQETLDVIVEQLQLMADGIHGDELRRLKVQIRSGMIMQQESCRARARSIATDWSHLGRVRLLDEINDAINSLTVDSINDFLREQPPANFNVVTLGPSPLKFEG